jgi:hypothetical protein
MHLNLQLRVSVQSVHQLMLAVFASPQIHQPVVLEGFRSHQAAG